MNDYQAKLKSDIQRIFSILGKQASNIKAYHDEIAKITPLPYIEQEKEKMRNKAEAALYQASRAVYEDIQKQLDSIRSTAVSMETEFQITPDLQAAIALVSAAGDKMNYETRSNLVKSFVGRKQALIALQSMFIAQGIESPGDGEIARFIFSAEAACDELDKNASWIAVQPGKSMVQIMEFSKLLENFAELEGAELSMKISDFVDTDAYYMGLARAASGLTETR